MNRSLLRVVLVVSCAHAMVHVFEQSVASVEQIVGQEFSVGTAQSGLLGTAFRLPFGLLALFAGYWADRLGARRMLIVFLVGCALSACAMLPLRQLSWIQCNLLVMGCFASIYHPAGLALISRAVPAEQRGMALGVHGVLGSIGIAGAPFIAALAFSVGGFAWRQYYALLAVPAGVIAVLVFVVVRERPPPPRTSGGAHPEEPTSVAWRSYLRVVMAGGLSGVVYGGFLHFLPRYLDSAGVLASSGLAAESARNYLTAGALLCGAVGQFTAGWFARPSRLEAMMLGILLVSVPLLLGMSLADGGMRLLAASAFALVHFMNQPVINSLLPQYVPLARRSAGFGFSNLVGFGCSAAGPALTGLMHTDRQRYVLLAGVAAAAACVAWPLLREARRRSA